MKKLLAFLLTISLFVPVFPFVQAEEEKPETFRNGDWEYIILEDGTAEIARYNGNEAALSVPGELDGRKVTEIGEKAFWYCLSLTSVTIPDSVTGIGEGAFVSCSSLASVTIPDSVTSIGDGAFLSCSSLASVTIPDSLTGIGDETFSNCMSLTSVTIPDGAANIGNWSFSGCRSLTSVTIPDSVTGIGDYAFFGCPSVTAVVGRNSYAEQYCEKKRIKYTYADANN